MEPRLPRLLMFLCVLFVLYTFELCNAFQIYDASNLTSNPDTGAYFIPHSKGFVGYYGDPLNKRRERINEGNSFTSAHPRLWDGVVAEQNCPGMVGPVDGNKYYCNGREFGYCDRRSGTCFCNIGYQGLDCSECTPTHFRVGALCYPKKTCPNDCSRSGICDPETGKCQCLNNRIGSDCAIMQCTGLEPLCETCTSTECLSCREGFYLNDQRQCVSCTTYDPRCLECDKDQCYECSDLLLWSVRRSGARTTDPELPADELSREFSFTFPFGSQDPRVFDEAEVFFMLPTDAPPLQDSAIACDQGTTGDESWACNPVSASHKICGAFGVFTFSSPTYEVSETGRTVRVNVKRSGGGMGDVSVSYDIRHLSTNASDVQPTMFYTTSQILEFTPGIVEKSFLIPILDDGLEEEDERFQVVLLDPTNGATLGNQFSCIVTILDDDRDKVTASHTHIIDSSTVLQDTRRRLSSDNLMTSDYGAAGDSNRITIQSVKGNGDYVAVGGGNFHCEYRYMDELENHQVVRESEKQGAVERGTVVDQGDGTYEVLWSPSGTGKIQLSIYQSVQGGLKGEYYDNAWFEGEPAVSRIDREVNFNWGKGYLYSTASDYLTVRWSGDLEADLTGLVNIYVLANDHVRLWIDRELVLDQWEVRSEIMLSVSRNLRAGELYYIELEYRELTGDASIQLLWGLSGQDPVVIPDSNLYWRDHINGSPLNNVTVLASVISAENSIAYGEALSRTVAGKPSEFKITPLDALYNLIDDPGTTQNPSVRLDLVSLNGGGVGTPSVDANIEWEASTQSFVASYTAYISGIYSAVIKINDEEIFGSPFSIQVHPGPCQGRLSQITGPGISGGLVAGETTSVEIRTFDTFQNIKSVGGNVFKIMAYHAELNEADLGTVTDNGDGTYLAYFTPRFKGVYSLSIILNENEHVDHSPYSISVEPNVPNGPQSTIASGEEATVEGFTGVINTFDFQARDLHSNALDVGGASCSVYLVPSNGNPNVIGGCADLTNGQYRVTYDPQNLGSNALHVTINGEDIMNSPFDLSVIAGPSAGQSGTLSGEGVTFATAGISAEFYIQIRDFYGNEKVYGAGSEVVIVTIQDNDANFITVNVEYDRDGKYVATYTATLAGTYTLSVTIDAVAISAGDYTLSVVPGILCGACSRVQCTIGSACETTVGLDSGYEGFIAGEVMTWTIYSKDLFYNQRVSGGDRYQAVATDVSSNATQSLVVVDNFDGTYVIPWVPSVSGKYSLRVTAAEPGGLSATYYGNPQLLSPELFSRVDRMSEFSQNFGYISPDGMDLADGFSVRWEGYLLPLYTEIYRFYISAAKDEFLDSTGGVRLFINDELVIDTWPSDYWSDTETPTRWANREGSIALSGNQLTKIRMDFSEGTFQSSIALRWSSMSQEKTIIQSQSLFSIHECETELPDAVIYPAALHSASSTIDGVANTVAVSGTESIFTVVARDEFGNARLTGGDFIHTNVIAENAEDQDVIEMTVTDNENGTYSVTYTPTSAGRYRLVVAITAAQVLVVGLDEYAEELKPKNVLGSPFILSINANSPVAEKSTVFGDGSITSEAGSNASMTLELRDLHDNLVKSYDGGVWLRLELLSDTVEASVVPTLQGLYSVSYVPKIAGAYNVAVQIDSAEGYVLTSNTASVIVKPTVPSGTTSAIDAEDFDDTIALDTPYTFTVSLRDEFSNFLDGGGYPITVVITGPATVLAPAIDLGNGQYVVVYQVPTPGTYSIQMRIMRGSEASHGTGLLASYYDTAAPSVTPIHQRVETEISKNWEEGDELTKVYGSATWIGYIWILYSEEYTFSINIDGAAALTIGDTLVINDLEAGSATTDGTLTGSIRLVGNTVYPIVVEYQRREAVAGRIALYWSSVATPHEVVPQKYLFTNYTEVLPRRQVLGG